jgi:hypothetical protein
MGQFHGGGGYIGLKFRSPRSIGLTRGGLSAHLGTGLFRGQEEVRNAESVQF